MKIRLTEIKNTIKVANATGKEENFFAKISNKERDFKITVSYFPLKDIEQDIYPYFFILMEEEELMKKVYLDAKEIRKVRDIYNSFTSQGENSFLLNYNQ